jgi:hypothetical protein
VGGVGRRCAPLTITGESRNGSTWCGSDRHPLPLRRGSLPVHASHRCGRLRALSLRPSVDACRCAPPIVAGESTNGSAWCGGDRHPTFLQARMHAGEHLPPSRASPEMTLRGVVAADTPPIHPGAATCWCAPPTIAGKSRNGFVQCGGD